MTHEAFEEQIETYVAETWPNEPQYTLILFGVPHFVSDYDRTTLKVITVVLPNFIGPATCLRRISDRHIISRSLLSDL